MVRSFLMRSPNRGLILVAALGLAGLASSATMAEACDSLSCVGNTFAEGARQAGVVAAEGAQATGRAIKRGAHRVGTAFETAFGPTAIRRAKRATPPTARRRATRNRPQRGDAIAGGDLSRSARNLAPRR
jgi:hypothetical protein